MKFSKHLVLGLWAATSFGYLPDEQNNIDLYKSLSPAVVNITATTLQRNFFFDLMPHFQQRIDVALNDVGKMTRFRFGWHARYDGWLMRGPGSAQRRRDGALARCPCGEAAGGMPPPRW
jgi:hypothetical protein